MLVSFPFPSVKKPVGTTAVAVPTAVCKAFIFFSAVSADFGSNFNALSSSFVSSVLALSVLFSPLTLLSISYKLRAISTAMRYHLLVFWHRKSTHE
jgi:hypothetical protein